MPKSFSLEEAYAKPVESPVKKSFSLEEAYGEEPKQDNAIQRGFKSMASSSVSTSKLATKDYEGIADEQLEMAKYREANPGNKAGNDMMEGWQAGDGEEKDTFMGGVRGASHVVADKFRKAEGFIPKARVVADTAGGALSILGEQVPNMIPGLVGMGAGALGGTAGGAAVGGPIGGTVGGIAGSVAGAGLGNTLVGGGEMIQHDLQKAGIAPGDREATKAYLEQHGDTILGQAGVKGTIIGAIDRATLGAGHYLLTEPAKQAMNRALTQLGVDTADSAAVAAAKVGQREAIGRLIAGDAVYQSSKTGVGNVARNTGAFALEPAGEFAGEYIGTGVARDEWDAKNAGLEAIMSLGQSGLMYGGQKAVQALQKPFEQNGQQTPPPAPQPTPEDPALPTTEPALELAPIDAGQQSTELSSPVADQVAPQPPTVVVQTPEGNQVALTEGVGSLQDAAVAAARSGAIPQAAPESAANIAATDHADLAPTLTAAADVATPPVTRQAFDTAIESGDLATANAIGSELYRQANEQPVATTQDTSQVANTTTDTATQPAYTVNDFQGVWNVLSSSDQAAIARKAGINERGVSGNDWQRVSPRDRQQLVDAMNTGVELQDSALAAQWDALTPALRTEHLVSSGMFANPNSVAAEDYAQKRTWDFIPTHEKDKLAAVLTQQAAQPASSQPSIESVDSNSSPVVPAKIQLTRTGNNYTVDAQNAPAIAAALGDTVEAGKTYSYPTDEHKALAEALQGKVELLTPKVTQKKKRQTTATEIVQRIRQGSGISSRHKSNFTVDKAQPGLFQNTGKSPDEWVRILASEGFDLSEDSTDGGVSKFIEMVQSSINGNKVGNFTSKEEAISRQFEDREIEALIADAAEIGIIVERKRGETSKQLFDRVDAMKQAASTTPEADAAVEALAPMLSADDKAAIIATPEQAVDSLTNQDGIWFNEFLEEWQDSKGNPVQETQNERNTAETSQSNTEQVPEGTAEANPVARSNAKADLFGEDTTTKQAIHDRKLDKDAKRSGGENPVATDELALSGSPSLADQGVAAKQTNMLDALDVVQKDAASVQKESAHVAEEQATSGALRKGEIGMKLGSGEVVITSSGRQTTPFPNIKTDTNRKALNVARAVDKWLMQNALDEARSRGDRFNTRSFEANLDKPHQSDRDDAEEYLFGHQPDVIPSILKPIREANQNPIKNQPKPSEAAQSGREPLDRVSAGSLKEGDIIEDDQKNQYLVHVHYYEWLDAFPIENGKANVSEDARVRFHLRPLTASEYPERKNAPVYFTGRNLYEEEKAKQAAISTKSTNANDEPYQKLVALKSTVLLDSNLGSDIYSVKLSVPFKAKYRNKYGAFELPRSDNFEIKDKAEVTGNVYDDGYILIDKRKQRAERLANDLSNQNPIKSENAPVAPPMDENAPPDLEYRKKSDGFTQFLPNTKPGEDAWREIVRSNKAAWADFAEGAGIDPNQFADGNVHNSHVKQLLKHLEAAGIRVEKAKKPQPLSSEDDDALLADLMANDKPTEEPAVEVSNDERSAKQELHYTFAHATESALSLFSVAAGDKSKRNAFVSAKAVEEAFKPVAVHWDATDELPDEWSEETLDTVGMFSDTVGMFSDSVGMFSDDAGGYIKGSIKDSTGAKIAAVTIRGDGDVMFVVNPDHAEYSEFDHKEMEVGRWIRHEGGDADDIIEKIKGILSYGEQDEEDAEYDRKHAYAEQVTGEEGKMRTSVWISRKGNFLGTAYLDGKPYTLTMKERPATGMVNIYLSGSGIKKMSIAVGSNDNPIYKAVGAALVALHDGATFTFERASKKTQPADSATNTAETAKEGAGQSRKADVLGEKKLSAAERKQYTTDFMLNPVEIIEAMIDRGDVDALFKAAGLKKAGSFSGLPLEQQANAYTDAIEKGHSPVAITEDYNTKAMRLEHEATVRRLQEDAEVMQANGKPFKTSSSAGKFQATYALEDTHEITNVEGGFALKRLPPARRPSELKRIAEHQANDPETQRQEAAFAKAKAIGDAANPIVEKYGYGRIDIDTFESSLNDLSKGQSINQNTPLDVVFDRLTTDKSKAVKRVTREQVKERDDRDAILNIHDHFSTIVTDLKAANKLTTIGDC